MNIVLHIPALKTGGAERQLTYLAKGLADRSEVVHVVTFYSGGVFWDELSKDPRIKLHSLNRKSKWDFFITYKLVKYCKNNDIHLMQAFLAPSATIASLAVIILKIPLIIGIRTSGKKFEFGGRIYKIAERILGNLFARCYVCNSYAGMKYISSIGYKKSIIKVIPNGLKVPQADFSPSFHRGGVVRLGMICRLVPMKDVPTMLHALSLLVVDMGNVELLIYGDGEESYKQELAELCKKLDIEKKVIWKGWVSDVWDALGEIDILVSSSFSGEGLSNTLMEGLSARRIVISTDVGDARLLLEYEGSKAGYVVPRSNPQLLANALTYAIDNPKESLEYAEKGREHIEQHYSIGAMVDAYDNLYRENLS